MVKKFRLDEFGYEVVLNKYAQQADGAVWFQQGGTVVLATVVSAPSPEFPGFLPLTIDYREQFAAAGKIPGGYFKREGKFTDKEVLTGRLIDRAIRPLFPENYFHQIQGLATVYSVDKEHSPHISALVGMSLALTISKIPFMGPVGAIEVARVNGEWIFNPTYSQSLASDVKIIVAGTAEGICMVEGCTNEISEEQFVDILFRAHEKIKKQVAWQEEIAREVHVPKEAIEDLAQWNEWKEKIKSFLTLDKVSAIFMTDKIKRDETMEKLHDEMKKHFEAAATEEKMSMSVIDYIYDSVLKEKITSHIFETGKRIDERGFDQVRKISVEVGLLPFTHGSALFTRGRTQVLASVTMGGGQDEQKIEDLMGNTIEKSFMLHYNFPPFSAGDVRPMRGPGRREVGHGYLAASALHFILPTKEQFPYTVRVVADVLESDGSTSMGTVCSSVMALMNAGVPIRKMVSGTAMGLLRSSTGTFQALTDISGTEDAYGLMDFKVAGTADGITAIQMDIKYKGGLPRSVFEKALEQAKRGRLHILGEMQKVMTAPNPTLSDLVPKIVTFKVETDKIGAIIGTGGKVIREIIEKTGTMIDIEGDGTVKIFGGPEAKIDEAVNWVKLLGGLIDRGSIYRGKIRRIADFGIFVELVPGQDGLVHISMIPREKQRNLSQEYPIDSDVMVEVIDYDPVTGRIRLRMVDQ
ncbi:MAG: Polyribonucleotide nucleotidyltransferase [Candidatus Dependentiae bacterium ADurb.Bin331]|nr:MAG: Polyribonucleotide nucleotidyltransferase [Candidatus Dependentiae bacterium ADurb.Bin331]